MGTIQNSINQALGTVATAATFGRHALNEEQKRSAEVKEAGQKLPTAEKAREFDAREAAAAIKAHAAEEGIADNKELMALLDETDPEKLAENVKSIRENELTTNRMERLSAASAKVSDLYSQPGVADLKDNVTGKELLAAQQRDVALGKAKTELQYAYDAERELNQRLQASAKIEGDIAKYRATIEARGNKSEKEMYLGGNK